VIVALDFETTYSVDYSLSKLSTEEYIRDPRFEVIGCSISLNGKPAVWYPQPEVEAALRAVDWTTSSLLAYNTVFDGAILAWKYGIYPALYLDAMGMAKALNKTYNGASLKKVAATTGVGVKGDYVFAAKGKRYADFLPHELVQYGEYCCNDTDLTVKLYRLLSVDFPLSEVQVQDKNLRLFIEPLLTFDVAALKDHRDNVVKEKSEKITEAMRFVGVDMRETSDPMAELHRRLMSNQQFAEVLRGLGVEPPTKLSPATGKETYAFAKTDEAFVGLLQHEDTGVQALVAARLGAKSTIEETRAEAFLSVASRGLWPVQINYYGGHPGRFSGAGGLNSQNLRRGGRLRDAILPPAGHSFVVGDLGAIECRVVNYMAGQDDVIEAFRQYDAGIGQNVYCIMAEKIFGCEVKKTDKEKYTPGKVAELSLGFGGGWEAYKRGIFAQAKLQVQQHEAQRIVDIYRRSHGRVERLWRQGNDVLRALLRGQPFTFGREGLLNGTNPELGIGLPNGLFLQYPELRQQMNAKGEVVFLYTSRGKPKEVRGSILVQNLTEALARIILTDAWLRVAGQLRIVMHQHDELAAVVPHADVQDAMSLMHNAMTWPVSWAPDLPIACEVQSGLTYGEARR